MRNRIVIIHTDHPNDPESVEVVRDAFAAFGYIVDNYSIGDPEFRTKFSTLMTAHRHEIFCFVSWNYTAATLRADARYLHAATGIPLVIWLFDHPIYTRGLHVPELADTIVFVQGEDAYDFVERHFASTVAPVIQTGPFPQHYDHAAPDFDEFVTRRNEIVSPMNLHVGGMAVDDAWQRIRALPPQRRVLAKTLIDELLYDTRTPLHGRAEELRESLGLDAEVGLSDMQLTITFLKLWRRDRMVRALIELPIVVSTEWAPADLELRYPGKFTLFSMRETLPLYRQFRFVLNAYPIITHTFHDRVLHALFANTVCITDANLITARTFSDQRDMIFFDYEHADRMKERVAHYLDNPEAAFALTVSAFETARANKPLFFDSYQRLIDAVAAKWNMVPLVGGV